MTSLALEFAILLACICCSTYFSATETAIMSLSKLKLRQIIDRQPSRRKRYYQDWMERRKISRDHPAGQYFGGGGSVVCLFHDGHLSNILHLPSSEAMASGVATGFMTFLLLIFEWRRKRTPSECGGGGRRLIGILYRLSNYFQPSSPFSHDFRPYYLFSVARQFGNAPGDGRGDQA